ncbi:MULTISPECIES: hypothetical protein [unclassified Massilia]|uniref:hypothetical protein n=1 Tax=unclassified Massilia TaxID=2609279 RepID=UPI00177A95F4|nr:MULTISPECIES: hypothetical protein [unclassified Massilia]MBD8531240.1 hypothetical protein [Massilia sp. CFBP 13647]MBD8676497.1 hypothetical protein [Massilia sp. CFBP 13721]
MKRNAFAAVWLRLRIALAAANPVALGALVLCIGAAAALAWLLPARELVEESRVLARRQAALPAAQAAAPVQVEPATDEYHLALFNAALGDRRHAERQVKTLFALAAKSGLVLRQGEYKAAFERNARLHTYQVTLPVKGSYNAIWQFALGALRAIPFAALDEISFKRDAIGETEVEARLRITLYLLDRPGEGS